MNLISYFLTTIWGRPRPVSPMPPPSPVPAVDGPEAMILIEQINRLRARMNLPMLTPAPPLMQSAQEWAEWMAKAGFLGHGDADARIQAHFPGSATGECIAEGQPTPADVARAWFLDEPHRVILLGDYNLVGCGLARNQAGIPYWVSDFARA